MRPPLKAILFFCGVVLSSGIANASTLTLSIEHHIAVDRAAAKGKLLRAAFTDAPALANIKLDVYALPQLPSTAKHLEQLQRLSPKTWWQELTWSVRGASGNAQQVRPKLLSMSVRRRGPNAPSEADRDTAVECTSYDATFDLGRLSPGDYIVQVAVGDLKSGQFPLAVRTGREPEVRDVYLQEKARETRTWNEFKAIELERLRLDPTKAAALLDLAERSLEFGTLEETKEYFERAATTMEQNIRSWAEKNPADARKQAPAVDHTVRQIRALQRELPEYFRNRQQWRVAIDGTTGKYQIVARDSNRVVRPVQ
jgi:hypothetical protein